MKLRTKILSLTGTALVIGSLAMVPASAAQADVVVYSGSTTPGGLTPVQTIGGSGTYAFNTSAGLPVVGGVCATAGTSTGTCGLAANGSYANVVCGTGTTGSTTLGVAEGDSATVSTVAGTFNFGIVFVAGVGIVHGHVSAVVGAGVSVLTPTGGSCASAVTTFVATGVNVVTDAA